MPRTKRICPPGIPLHIVQRGNNRKPCFRHLSDYKSYLDILNIAAKRYGVEIHAYAMMTNHVHLLVTPNYDFSASKTIQFLGRSYVMNFNRKHGRTGTLWEGRFRSAPVESERYLFACYRYIELNPVRAGMVELPEQYQWSSYRANAMGKENLYLSPHPQWISLGNSNISRRAAYRRMFRSPDDDKLYSEIRSWTR